MRRRNSQANPKLLVLRHAFRPRVSALFSGLASLVAFLAAAVTWDSENAAGLFALISGLIFLIAATDAAIPCKFRFHLDTLHYRDTFVWTSWRVSEIEAIEVVEETWLGLRVSLLSLHMRDSRTIRLVDTMSRKAVAEQIGGPVWAAIEISKWTRVPLLNEA